MQFGAALAKVANSIHLGAEDDETAAAAKWHLPEAHYLEAWGDAQSTDGVAAIQQPMIEPIFGGKSAIEVMAVLLDSKDEKATTWSRITGPRSGRPRLETTPGARL